MPRLTYAYSVAGFTSMRPAASSTVRFSLPSSDHHRPDEAAPCRRHPSHEYRLVNQYKSCISIVAPADQGGRRGGPPWTARWKAGLEDVIAARSAICTVDGEAGRLYYRGYEIGELAGRGPASRRSRPSCGSGSCPTPAEAEAFEGALRRARACPRRSWRSCARRPATCHPLDVLRTAVSFAAASIPTRGPRAAAKRAQGDPADEPGARHRRGVASHPQRTRAAGRPGRGFPRRALSPSSRGAARSPRRRA